MKKDIFKGNEFFKSTGIDDNGHLLQKAIPTMPTNEVAEKQIVASKPVVIPASVKAFKTKVESIFKELDKITMDMKEELNEWEMEYFCDSYRTFKKEFQRKINNIIQYPTSKTVKERIKKEKEGKINIL